MRGDVETIKERLDIAEIVSGYVKLDKAGQSFKGRCPFHNEKTPSFFVSPVRQSYYCFGCGAKGDIFTFVEELEGLSFKETLKMLAEKAGVELEYRPEAGKERSEKQKLLSVLEIATQFFEKELSKHDDAKKYLLSRGISEASIKSWRLGYAPAEWRALYTHMLQLGFDKEVLIKAGLVKSVTGTVGKEPYDVFRDRVIFPLFDAESEVIAFSGRALAKETEPKYVNSPETPVFSKQAVLYGLDRAKEKIRRKDYAVLVEGQVDLVLSHQAGVDNTVASSGTAFTAQHLERLKRLSKRIILAFDGDEAGEKAADKSTGLAISLGLEVKIASLPLGKDPAELVKENPDLWKTALKDSKPAIEYFLSKLLQKEKDRRKLGKAIGEQILPKIALLESSMERSHFISLITKSTGIKEDVVWDDLKKVKFSQPKTQEEEEIKQSALVKKITRSDEYREVIELLKENPEDKDLKKHKEELTILMRVDQLDEEIALLRLDLVEGDEVMLKQISALQRERDEEKRKVL